MTNRSLRIVPISPTRILARILDDASLVATVQSLPPRTLGRLIHHIGIEDSGELIALATTEQLERIFDDDLWVSEGPGRDETFDADRFALWLEVMLEAGEDFAAQKLLELPEDMVTLALHRNVLVLDIDQLQREMQGSDDAEQIDKALEGCLSEELGAYQIIARRHDGWDAIVSILLALDMRDHAFVVRVLERCCAMSSEHIDESGGLQVVLNSEEMTESDLAGEREDRRAAEGFIAPSQAASFLALCRSTLPEDVVAAPRDAVTRAYFRELAREKISDRIDDSPKDHGVEIGRLLNELEVDELQSQKRPMLALEAENVAAETDMFKTALAALRDRDPRVHAQRMEELAYLTNVLVSGASVDGRAFRPFEAAVAVAAACNLGLDHLANGDAERALDCLVREGADKWFRIGWWLQHHDVGRRLGR